MDCLKCGSKIEEGFAFCAKCGASVAEQNGKKPCPACSSLENDTFVYCSKCGARMDGKSICSNCQEELVPDARFCPKCGAGVSAKQHAGTVLKSVSGAVRKTVEVEKKHGFIRSAFILAFALAMLFIAFAPVITVSSAGMPSQVNMPFTLEFHVSPIQVIEAGFSGEIDEADFLADMKKTLENSISDDTFDALSRGQTLTVSQQREIEKAFGKINVLKAFQLSSVRDKLVNVRAFMLICAFIALLLVIAPIISIILGIVGLVRKKAVRVDFMGILTNFAMWLALLFALRIFDGTATPGGGFVAIMILGLIAMGGLFTMNSIFSSSSKGVHLGAIRNAALSLTTIILAVILTLNVGSMNYKYSGQKKENISIPVSSAIFIVLTDQFTDEDTKPVKDAEIMKSLQHLFELSSTNEISKSDLKTQLKIYSASLFFTADLVNNSSTFYVFTTMLPYMLLVAGLMLMAALIFFLKTILTGKYKQNILSSVFMFISVLFMALSLVFIIITTSIFSTISFEMLKISFTFSPAPIVAISLAAIAAFVGITVPVKSNAKFGDELVEPTKA